MRFTVLMACLIALTSGRAICQENPEAPVCPLSDSQIQKSTDAFAKIAKVLTTEKRCSNCHGGVNPYIDGVGPDPGDRSVPPSLVEHGGGKIQREGATSGDGQPLIDTGCVECHNHMAQRRDGSPSRWMTAPGFLSFVGKDAPTLCRQVKRSSRSAQDFIGHLKDDNGGNNFGETAFNGDRGLDRTLYSESELPAEKPSISHDTLLKIGQDWIDAMGGEFKAGQDCGCVPIHYAIRLTATIETAIAESSVRASMNVEVPIAFADDGSFTGQGVATIEQSGGVAGCRLQGSGNVGLKASGNAVETAQRQSMHLQVDQGSSVTLDGTMTCPDGLVMRAAAPPALAAIPPFDLKGLVGETIDKPIADIPGMTTRVHLEIVERQP